MLKKLKSLSLNPVLRVKEDIPFITDNYNYIVDLHLGKEFDIKYVLEKLKGITGVLETGLFLNTCNKIIIATSDGVKVVENPNRER